MKKQININSTDVQIDLEKGKYRIDILGGWGVTLENFSIAIKDTETQHVINCEKTIWKVQSFAFRKRAKRIFVVQVPRSAKYEIIFEQSESIKVKASNLYFSSFFKKPLPNKDLEIYFH